MEKRAPLLLAAVLVLAFGLRVWGLTWGLPTATHYFSYHPDESVVLGYAMSVNVLGGQFLPHFYNYGSLQLYLVNIAATVAAAYGGASLVIKDLARDWPQWAHLYLVGRVVTVAMGVGTVWGVYALGEVLYGRRAGLLGATLLAVMPLHAQHSHFLTVDVPAAFWGTWSMFWAARLMGLNANAWKPALWAGLLAGLAIATKYNMALLLLPIMVAVLASSRTAAQKAQALAVVAFSMGTAFIVGCPGSVLETGSISEPRTFLHDVHFEAVHVQNTQDPTFRDTGSGFLFQWTHNLSAGMGWPLLIVTLFCIIYACYRRAKGDALLAAFALPYYILISLAAVRYARYDIPLLPVLALLAGRMVADGSRASRPRLRQFTLACAAPLLTVTLCSTLLLLHPMTQIDPRDAALMYLNAHAPSPTPVAFASQPWFGSPPLSPYFSNPGPGAWEKSISAVMRQRVLYGGKDWDVGMLNQHPPFIVLNEYDYRDGLRLHDPAVESYLQKLGSGWQEVAVFSSASRTNGLPVHNLPHDMLYPNPAVVVFRRRP